MSPSGPLRNLRLRCAWTQNAPLSDDNTLNNTQLSARRLPQHLPLPTPQYRQVSGQVWQTRAKAAGKSPDRGWAVRPVAPAKCVVMSDGRNASTASAWAWFAPRPGEALETKQSHRRYNKPNRMDSMGRARNENALIDHVSNAGIRKPGAPATSPRVQGVMKSPYLAPMRTNPNRRGSSASRSMYRMARTRHLRLIREWSIQK